MFGTLVRSFAHSSEHMQVILKQIKSNPVLVYSKQTCPFCSAAKSTFAEMKVNCKVIELDVEKNGDHLKSALKELTMQTTVPNIFIGGSHIGGYTELSKGLKTGAVQEKLKDAKVEYKDID